MAQLAHCCHATRLSACVLEMSTSEVIATRHANQVRQFVVWRRPAYEVLREYDPELQFDWTPVTYRVALAHWRAAHR